MKTKDKVEEETAGETEDKALVVPRLVMRFRYWQLKRHLQTAMKHANKAECLCDEILLDEAAGEFCQNIAQAVGDAKNLIFPKCSPEEVKEWLEGLPVPDLPESKNTLKDL